MMTVQTHITDQSRAKWDAAWKRMSEAEAAFQEYVDATDPVYFLETAFLERNGFTMRSRDIEGRLALLAANPAYAVPKHMNDHRDHLCDTLVNCAADLMATPAPDLAALRWKLDWTGDATYVEDYLAQMRADIDRLMGPALSPMTSVSLAEGLAA